MGKKKTMSAIEIHGMVLEECQRMVELGEKHGLQISANMLRKLQKAAEGLVVVEMAQPGDADLEELKVDVMVGLEKARTGVQGAVDTKRGNDQLREAARKALGQKAGRHARLVDDDKVQMRLQRKLELAKAAKRADPEQVKRILRRKLVK